MSATNNAETRHRVVTVKRGETADGRPGYAARCETEGCGAITFGGFSTQADARAALFNHEADDGEVVVATWPASGARFAPEVVGWARDVLASGVSGPRNDERAPTDAATSTGASPTPSQTRSKTMSSITETPAWATTSTTWGDYEGNPLVESAETFTTHQRPIGTLYGRDDSVAQSEGVDEVRVLLEQTDAEPVHVLIETVGRHGLLLDAAQARKLAAALLEAADLLDEAVTA